QHSADRGDRHRAGHDYRRADAAGRRVRRGGAGVRHACRDHPRWRVAVGVRVENIASSLTANLVQTGLDVLPIILVVALFQALAFRRRPPRMRRILTGALAIILGITLFRTGLDLSLLPMGVGLAESLAVRVYDAQHSTIGNALWLVVFAAALGLAATLIEPTLTAVADRVRDLSGETLRPFSFRLAVAIGVAVGLALG